MAYAGIGRGPNKRENFMRVLRQIRCREEANNNDESAYDSVFSSSFQMVGGIPDLRVGLFRRDVVPDPLPDPALERALQGRMRARRGTFSLRMIVHDGLARLGRALFARILCSKCSSRCCRMPRNGSSSFWRRLINNAPSREPMIS